MTLFNQSQITPEYIKGKLFSFHNAAHSLHQDTKLGWEHDALSKLYEGLEDFKDSIPEKLMGYMGKRIGQIKLDSIPMYSPQASNQLCQEILKFSKQLCEFGKYHGFLDTDNEAAALSGLAAQTIYRLTLS